ncbi:MAG: hypothetical protein HQ461_11765 [Deltaproteobacteria bacterium]|nr:hypothetical protein [Deltaproteobacteria bacterium]
MAVTSRLGIAGLLLLFTGCTAAGVASVETPERSDSGRPTTGDTSTADGTTEDVLGDGSGSSADTTADGSAAEDASVVDSGSGSDATSDAVEDASDGSADGPVICATTTAPAVPAILPADIIWVVDNSLSMQEEVTAVSANLNRFANFIIASGIDAQVVMVSNDDPTVGDGKYHVCVPPPLSATAAGVCPLGRDLDGERYYHERVTIEGVSSSNTRTNALTAIVSGYPNYRSRLRPGATTHIVVVSDDDSAITAAEFDAQLAGLAPGFLRRPIVHSIVTRDATELESNMDGCVVAGCPCGYRVGTEYLGLSAATGGIVQSICAADWGPVSDAIAAAVVETTSVPCSYAIPSPGGGLSVNPEQVNVYSAAAGERTLIPNVADASACGPEPGWYYDNPAAPRTLELCNASCVSVTGSVEIDFGCDTVKR